MEYQLQIERRQNEKGQWQLSIEGIDIGSPLPTEKFAENMARWLAGAFQSILNATNIMIEKALKDEG